MSGIAIWGRSRTWARWDAVGGVGIEHDRTVYVSKWTPKWTPRPNCEASRIERERRHPRHSKGFAPSGRPDLNRRPPVPQNDSGRFPLVRHVTPYVVKVIQHTDWCLPTSLHGTTQRNAMCHEFAANPRTEEETWEQQQRPTDRSKSRHLRSSLPSEELVFSGLGMEVHFLRVYLSEVDAVPDVVVHAPIWVFGAGMSLEDVSGGYPLLDDKVEDELGAFSSATATSKDFESIVVIE